MKCPICKGTNEENAKRCKYCGYDFYEKNIASENEFKKIEDENNGFEIKNDENLRPYTKRKIIDMYKEKEVYIPILVLFGLIIILFFYLLFFSYKYKEVTNENELYRQNEQDIDELKNKYDEDVKNYQLQLRELNQKILDMEEENTIKNYGAAEEVKICDFIKNNDLYIGKRIIINCICDTYDEDSDVITMNEFGDYDSEIKITALKNDSEKVSSGDYITINGYFKEIDSNGNPIFIETILCNENATEEYNIELQEYEENVRISSMSSEELFKERAETPTYEELRRYPDTYKDKPLKLTIYVEDIDPDGWIFPGDIIATYQGEELAVYDDREIREPRILEGDTITVYAVGYGLTKMQVKQKGLVFNKTVDEYDVPAIQIKYTENDDLSYKSTGDYEEKVLNETGKDVGEIVDGEIESIDWDENKENAREAGEKAAEWINELIE